jgi:hypothetical protein
MARCSGEAQNSGAHVTMRRQHVSRDTAEEGASWMKLCRRVRNVALAAGPQPGRERSQALGGVLADGVARLPIPLSHVEER